MPQFTAVGKFDLDITLRDAALDENNRPTRRMIANACIGVEAFDAYYAAKELLEAVEDLHNGRSASKSRLAAVLANQCDDFQRCLYFALAGRGIVQMLEDLDWLCDLLEARTILSASLFKDGKPPIAPLAPYVAAQPDAVIPSADPDFEQGPSWYLDPALGGEVTD